MMVGLGETKDQIIQSIENLAVVNCDIITIGQYLRPSPEQVPVRKFYRPKEFDELKEIGEYLGLGYEW